MIQRTHFLVVVLSLLILIALSEVKTIASSDDVNQSFFKATVNITNRLGDGSTLNLQCKSADDDLGLKFLAPNSSWYFKFRPNFWGTTLFACDFTYPPEESKHFVIYDDSRDGGRADNPCIDCFWDITRDGPCRFNHYTNAFDIRYDWDGHLIGGS